MDLQAFIEIKETKDSILEKLKYLKETGLNEYLTFAVSEMGLKILLNLQQKSGQKVKQHF